MQEKAYFSSIIFMFILSFVVMSVNSWVVYLHIVVLSCTFVGIMKHILLLITLATMLLSSCSQSDEDRAKPLLAKIDSLYKSGNYRVTLDSITLLRDRYPKAIEARRHALEIWHKASLKMAQEDVAKTGVQLQEIGLQINQEQDRYRRNLLLVKRDSLQARYEAMCGVVRMIRMRQKEH